MVVAYRDKYGPLGKIAIAQGRRTGPREIALDAWAMSCRAFARRVEHRCLEQMMVHLDADAVTLDYAPTDRNGVLRDFLADLLGAQPAPGSRVTREALLARCPPLYHEVADPGA
jgi:predicted enzyme involved in methoxymalonyl-ACP biosynthesis